MFPRHHRNYTFYQNSGALLIAIFGAMSVADYSLKIVSIFFEEMDLFIRKILTRKWPQTNRISYFKSQISQDTFIARTIRGFSNS